MSIESTSRRLRARQRGVTLIELILFMVIVAIALAGIIAVMRLTTAESADPLRRKQALMIAEGLLEEVQGAAFTFCDPASDNAATAASSAACAIPEAWGQTSPEPTGTRPYDNVNDYVGAAGVAMAAFDANGVPVGATGKAIGAEGYAARVTIFREGLHNIAAPAGSSADVDVLRIRVSVSFPGDDPVVLDGYRTRYDPRGG